MVVASYQLSWSGLDIVLRNNFLYAKAFLIVLKNKNIQAYLRNTISLAYHPAKWEIVCVWCKNSRYSNNFRFVWNAMYVCVVIAFDVQKKRNVISMKKGHTLMGFFWRKQAIYDVCIDLRGFWQWTKFSQRKWTYFLRHRLKHTMSSWFLQSSLSMLVRLFCVQTRQCLSFYSTKLREWQRRGRNEIQNTPN